MTRKTFKVGARVRDVWVRGLGQDGGELGTVVGLPRELGGQRGVGLYAVLLDSGEIHGFAPDALELCDGAVDRGLQIAVQVLDEKREDLLHDLLCLVAACRRIDLRDPSVRQQVEAEVRRMAIDWFSADAAASRRKEFADNPELRKRLIRSLTAYLETGDLIRQLMGLIDGDSPVDAGPCR
jgi:hypothetical protein